MLEELPLAQFQRWMAAVVTHFGTDEEAWNSDAAIAEFLPEEAQKTILPTDNLTEYERIGIYRKMYFLRMRDALAIDVPAVRHFLGSDVFEAVVEDYFTRFPSTSYTLNDSGLKFPQFVRESSLPNKDFIAELAELELAIARVMEAEEIPPLAPEQLTTIPADKWEYACFTPVTAFEIHSFTYPVRKYLVAFEEEADSFPHITPNNEFLFIHRSDYSTRHYALQEPEFQLLSLLTNSTPLTKAFETIQESFLASSTDQASEEIIENLQNRISSCFQQWITMGIFAKIHHNVQHSL